jgi:hypothetical protein
MGSIESKVFILLSPYEKSGINSISAQQWFGIILSHS